MKPTLWQMKNRGNLRVRETRLSGLMSEIWKWSYGPAT